MSTGNDKNEWGNPDFEQLLSDTSFTPKPDFIARLQSQIALQRHAPGWLGAVFGGKETASTNIIGLVAILAMVTIALLGWSTQDPSAIVEICKAVLFLAIGSIASKKLND